MELYDAMSTLRAVRRLRSDPIDDEIVQRILTAATWAPTGGNMQPWRIVAVTDADKKQRLEDLYRPHWDSYLPGYEKKIAGAPDSIRKPAERAMEAGNYLANHMHEVPMTKLAPSEAGEEAQGGISPCRMRGRGDGFRSRVCSRW